MSTYFPKPGEIVRKWYVVDADGQTLGRLASQVARVLMGKENPQYTPFLDTGDHVIVVNAEKIRTTGVKSEQKQYHHYTGYPGGLRTVVPEMIAYLFDKAVLNRNWRAAVDLLRETLAHDKAEARAMLLNAPLVASRIVLPLALRARLHAGRPGSPRRSRPFLTNPSFG